jgi:hypothetical protein
MDLHNNREGVYLRGSTLQDCFDECEQRAKQPNLYWFASVSIGDPRRGLPSDFPGFNIDQRGFFNGGQTGTGSSTPPTLRPRSFSLFDQ